MQIPTVTSNIDIDATLEELKAPTIRVPEANEADFIDVVSEEIKPDAEDFEPKKEETIENVVTNDNQQQAAISEQPVPASPLRQKMSAKTSAELVVSFEDNLQQLVLPPLYQRFIFTAAEKTRIREMKLKKLTNPDIEWVEQTDIDLWDKYKDFSDLKELLPFDEREKNLLTECWEAIIKENPRLALSPFSALIMAHGQIMGVRLLPLLSRLTL